MSDKLAISSALSVLLMAGFALFSGDVSRTPLAGHEAAGASRVSAGSAPALPALLPQAR